jgi:hypothetical protein
MEARVDKPHMVVGVDLGMTCKFVPSFDGWFAPGRKRAAGLAGCARHCWG